jgi:hypothetical protein
LDWACGWAFVPLIVVREWWGMGVGTADMQTSKLHAPLST